MRMRMRMREVVRLDVWRFRALSCDAIAIFKLFLFLVVAGSFFCLSGERAAVEVWERLGKAVCNIFGGA